MRARLFVDLYNVVRHGIRASVESYSIKKLEPLYNYERDVVLSSANSALSKVQACMELGDRTGVDDEDCRTVQGYNRDDCTSTWRLREATIGDAAGGGYLYGPAGAAVGGMAGNYTRQQINRCFAGQCR